MLKSLDKIFNMLCFVCLCDIYSFN